MTENAACVDIICNRIKVAEIQKLIAARDEALRRYEKAIFNLENLRVGKRPEELEVIAKTLLQAEADQDYNRR